MTTIASRPKTCAEQAVLDPTLGAEGCKRLPRHKGDHRATLTQPRVTRATKTRRTGRRASKAGLKRLAVSLAAKVDANEMAPSLAMARYAAYVTRLAAQRRARSVKAEAVAE